MKITDILRTNCPYVVHHSINLMERLPSFSTDTPCVSFIWAAAQVHAEEDDRADQRSRFNQGHKRVVRYDTTAKLPFRYRGRHEHRTIKGQRWRSR